MNKFKKIVIAADIYAPDIGGPATYSTRLKKELENKGVEVKLICYSDKPGNDVFRVVRSGNTLVRYIKYFLKLKKIAKETDVIYAMGPVSAGLPAMWVAKFLKKPLIVKVVGDYAWEQARNQGFTEIGIDEFQKEIFSGKIGKLQKIERRVCKFATKVITPSEYLKSIVSGWGIDENKVEVIYNSFKLPPEELKENPKDKNTLISAGRFLPWKGFDTLISLMPELIKEVNPDLVLKIYGSGPEKEKLENLIRELKLENTVTIKHVAHEELLESMSGAGGFILNSGYEGLSHAVLEAMSIGVPIVVSNIGGNPELIENNHNGILVDHNNKKQLKDAILKLHEDESLRNKFVENSKEVLNKFSFAEMINKTINILKSV